MGYVTAHGHCITCGKLFSFNPMRVPSTTEITGKREPLCEDCFTQINIKRKALGLEPFVAAPDAWEACEESELDG
jgi:hypothetical protein